MVRRKEGKRHGKVSKCLEKGTHSSLLTLGMYVASLHLSFTHCEKIIKSSVHSRGWQVTTGTLWPPPVCQLLPLSVPVTLAQPCGSRQAVCVLCLGSFHACLFPSCLWKVETSGSFLYAKAPGYWSSQKMKGLCKPCLFILTLA